MCHECVCVCVRFCLHFLALNGNGARQLKSMQQIFQCLFASWTVLKVVIIVPISSIALYRLLAATSATFGKSTRGATINFDWCNPDDSLIGSTNRYLWGHERTHIDVCSIGTRHLDEMSATKCLIHTWTISLLTNRINSAPDYRHPAFSKHIYFEKHAFVTSRRRRSRPQNAIN